MFQYYQFCFHHFHGLINFKKRFRSFKSNYDYTVLFVQNSNLWLRLDNVIFDPIVWLRKVFACYYFVGYRTKLNFNLSTLVYYNWFHYITSKMLFGLILPVQLLFTFKYCFSRRWALIRNSLDGKVVRFPKETLS